MVELNRYRSSSMRQFAGLDGSNVNVYCSGSSMCKPELGEIGTAKMSCSVVQKATFPSSHQARIRISDATDTCRGVQMMFVRASLMVCVCGMASEGWRWDY